MNTADSKQKKIANIYYVSHMVSDLVGLADKIEDVSHHFENLDPDNEQEIKNVFKEWTKPTFSKWDDSSKEIAKNSLRYFLSKNDTDWVRVFDASLFPFEHPSIARNFFVWLWEEYFPNEDYHIEDIDNYVVSNDANQTHAIRVKRE